MLNLETNSRKNICPVCGFELGFAPWKDNSPSDEICPSCGIQFGYDDAAGGNNQLRKVIYKNWREKWIEEGLQWYSISTPPPSDWDPIKQLQHVGVYLGE